MKSTRYSSYQPLLKALAQAAIADRPQGWTDGELFLGHEGSVLVCRLRHPEQGVEQGASARVESAANTLAQALAQLVCTLGWPTEWAACVAHYASLSREQIRAEFAAFCDARPVGGKFAHRATDGPAGSSPSMKWVNPPVAFMMHAGVPPLLAAGVHLPGLWQPGARPGAPTRVALEAYPGLLAREVLGKRSYKSDDPAKQTPERLIARKDLITALEQGQTRLGLSLKLSHAQRDALVDDASGDSLDAVLCLLQAAWAQRCHAAGDLLYGLPPSMDPLEGWIISAPWPA